MSFYKNMERIIKENGERGLEQLEFYYGVRLEVHRNVTARGDVYSQVHGRNSGKEGMKVTDITGILVGDDFFPADDLYTGGFDLGFLFTRSDKVKVGDTLKVGVSDGKIRRYKVESKEDIGLTTGVFVKWKLSNLGD